MVTEIQPHDIGTVLYNISTTTLTLTKAKKRWRRAFFTIHFSNTLVSIAKNFIEIIPQLVLPEVSINISDDHHLSCGIDELARLVNIVQDKDMETLHMFDGVKGLGKTLHTHLEYGIQGHDLDERRAVFGTNTYQTPPPRGLYHFAAVAFKDVTILILMGCAVLSLGFGIKKDGIKEGWYEGGSILLATFLVIVVSAISNFRQEKQFDNLSKISNNIKIDVVREGRRQKISIFDIVVGDIVVLNVGDQIPADGLFIDGHSLLVDESSLKGTDQSEQIEVNATTNPFLISGTEVADGHCRMLVLSVGMNTAWGKMMSSITDDNNEQTSLQSGLNKVGLAVAFLLLIVMLICYREHDGKHTSINKILDSVITGMPLAVRTIMVVAIREGLPLVVTLTLAYSMKRMMGHQAMVRKLSACETTVICTDKTGTLTTNQMTVTKFWLGLEFMEQHSSNVISQQVLEVLHEAVGFKHASRPEYTRSPTEKAILSWAVEDLGMEMKKMKKSFIVLVETFNWKKTRSGVLIKRKGDNKTHVHWKGAAEMVLAMCSKYYNSHGRKMIMDSDSRTQLENIIEEMATSGLKCIAFAHKKVPEGTGYQTLTEEGLTLLGIIGLKDPFRPKGGMLESDQEECEEEEEEEEVVESDQFGDFTYEEDQCEERSDIAFLDDYDIATVLMRGRCAYNKIQKFIQFQVTVNVGALLNNFTAAITSSGVPLTAVQLLWVNIIMDTLGSLALATKQPTKELLNKPTITNMMQRNLFALAAIQIIVLLTFHFNGKVIFNVEERVKNAIIFNIFVLCQVFNEFNSRKVEKRNIFEGIHKSRLFVGIIGIAIVLESVMVKFLTNFPNTPRSNCVQWGVSIAVAVLSWSSQKEDAWNDENDFVTTTVESMTKRTGKGFNF